MSKKQSITQAKIWKIPASSGTLLLKLLNKEIMIPILIGPLESPSFQHALSALSTESAPRFPLVHGSLLSLMESVGLSLLRIEIVELRHHVLHTRLVFTGKDYSEEEPLTAPITPADACVIAIMSECPIYVGQQVIDKIGLSIAHADLTLLLD